MTIRPRQNHDKGGDTEALLRAAADWMPERAAPEGLAQRALFRREKASARTSFSWWSIGTVCAAAAVAILFFTTESVTQPSFESVLQSAGPTVAPKTPEYRAPVEPAIVGETSAAATARKSRGSAPFRQGRRMAPMRSAARRPRHTTTQTRPETTPRANIAAAAAPPVVHWKNEVVEQENYGVIAPAIITEGSGSEQKETPVLVDMPLTPSGDQPNDAAY